MCWYYLLSRSAIAEANVRPDMGSSIDREMAGNIFGNDNLKNASYEMLAPSALAILCRNSDVEKSFTGFNFQGFDFGFCNDTWSVQTDVGVCIGGNPSQILMNGNILKQDQPRKINGGLKDIEHIVIIQVDEFSKSNEEQSYKVRRVFCIKMIYRKCVISNCS